MQVTIGGERLGAGKKMKANFNNYERSTHDLSYLWRSTMASGTLVPFMSELALPGDTFDINLGCSVLTHPTIGPLFGSYKVQLDVFSVPIRLYQSALHMNMLEIGMKMNTIKLPQLRVVATTNLDPEKDPDNQQINPSSILSYLGIRGLGLSTVPADDDVRRDFNAIPYLAYWDIYKQYYANKQEEIGAVIHTPSLTKEPSVNYIVVRNTVPDNINIPWQNTSGTGLISTWNDNSYIEISFDDQANVDIPSLKIVLDTPYEIADIFADAYQTNQNTIILRNPYELNLIENVTLNGILFTPRSIPSDNEPMVFTFPLKNIDDMRTLCLQNPPTNQLILTSASGIEPYNLILESAELNDIHQFSITKNQEGLALKTYQSDLFNNWLSTEWIDGEDGISAITAVSTDGNSFTIDELNMSKKIYDMLNRIALSGGTYDDWLDAVYTHERSRGQENPAYLGGLIKELVFQEVISNSASEGEPLGTLAGRGVMTSKHKGGKIIAKVDEPSYLIGLVSITPRIDYSQGNKWDTNLKTMDDLHKPALDEIGFQDLITDQMAWFDTSITADVPTFKSAGKQPAWINYMTNVNQVKGNFAEKDEQMFMVLNRRYDYKKNSDGTLSIKDLTTYIDPSKFNHIFADTRLDAQNFWTQISLDITARRKMSAKLIPNL